MSTTSFNQDHEVGAEEGERGGEKIMVKFTKSGNLVTTRMDVAGYRKCCQADDCSTDLTNAKEYYKRHKVCELHAKSPLVLVKSIPQRFCQQCSKFHDLSKFDFVKRSCRDRLAYHNERRRKSQQGKDVGPGTSPSPQVSSNITASMAKRHLNLNEVAIQSSASSSRLSTVAGNHHHHHQYRQVGPNAPNPVEMVLQNAPNYQAFAKAMMMANQQRTFF